MNFIIAIEPGTGTSAWGVVMPDLPGCFSAGDSLDEAMVNEREAIDQHVEIMSVGMRSLEDFAALEETAYLLRSPANAKRLMAIQC
jgi:predicted RNase H-like HicB family nuclease